MARGLIRWKLHGLQRRLSGRLRGIGAGLMGRSYAGIDGWLRIRLLRRFFCGVVNRLG